MIHLSLTCAGACKFHCGTAPSATFGRAAWASVRFSNGGPMKVNEYLKIESATHISRSEVGRLGTAIIFVVGVMIYTGARFAHVDQLYLLVAAAVIGAYMAMNIGANDVANNVGPAVGSFALSLTGAIVIAALLKPQAPSSRAETWFRP